MSHIVSKTVIPRDRQRWVNWARFPPALMRMMFISLFIVFARHGEINFQNHHTRRATFAPKTAIQMDLQRWAKFSPNSVRLYYECFYFPILRFCAMLGKYFPESSHPMSRFCPKKSNSDGSPTAGEILSDFSAPLERRLLLLFPFCACARS